jgi:predicted amidophosphoribosyltransferase
MSRQKLNDLVCQKCGKHFQKLEGDSLCGECRYKWWKFVGEHNEELSEENETLREKIVAKLWDEFLNPMREVVQFT